MGIEIPLWYTMSIVYHRGILKELMVYYRGFLGFKELKNARFFSKELKNASFFLKGA